MNAHIELTHEVNDVGRNEAGGQREREFRGQSGEPKGQRGTDIQALLVTEELDFLADDVYVDHLQTAPTQTFWMIKR